MPYWLIELTYFSRRRMNPLAVFKTKTPMERIVFQPSFVWGYVDFGGGCIPGVFFFGFVVINKFNT